LGGSKKKGKRDGDGAVRFLVNAGNNKKAVRLLKVRGVSMRSTTKTTGVGERQGREEVRGVSPLITSAA